MRKVSYIYALVHAGIFIASFFVDDVDVLVYVSTATCLIMMLDKLGKGLVLRETIALFNSFIYLFMPLMGYLFFTEDFIIAARFRRFMPIRKEIYFDLALPAISGFILMLCWPLKQSISDEGKGLTAMMKRAKAKLGGNRSVGITLMVVGVILSNFIGFFPKSLQYLVTLFYYSSFAGLLYIYFTDGFPAKRVLIGLFVSFVILGSLRNGMFTIIAYMGMAMFSFFFLERKFALWKKVVVFVFAACLLLIVQTIKSDYRKNVLAKDKDDKATEFVELARKKVSSTGDFFSPVFMWPIYYRTNQGFYVALVQKYIPMIKPHDGGEKLFLVILSSFVPRVLWPDKPMSGGEANMMYYAGYRLRGSTMDVGPLGEAYGSFGRTGAILYMLILGFFVRFVYMQVFRISQRSPLVILWLPVIFYMVMYSGENDTLQLVNSVIKTSLFIFMLSKMFPKLLNPPNPVGQVSIAQ